MLLELFPQFGGIDDGTKFAPSRQPEGAIQPVPNRWQSAFQAWPQFNDLR